MKLTKNYNPWLVRPAQTCYSVLQSCCFRFQSVKLCRKAAFQRSAEIKTLIILIMPTCSCSNQVDRSFRESKCRKLSRRTPFECSQRVTSYLDSLSSPKMSLLGPDIPLFCHRDRNRGQRPSNTSIDVGQLKFIEKTVTNSNAPEFSLTVSLQLVSPKLFKYELSLERISYINSNKQFG